MRVDWDSPSPAEWHVAISEQIQDELPTGLALDLLLLEVRQIFKSSATPFSVHPRRFDLPLDEALAVVCLNDRGFTEQTAWWLAREASITYNLELVSESR